MKVTLREKKLLNGDKSLYLDFYPPVCHPDTGELTRREFLKLRLISKPKSESEREANRSAKFEAETRRAERQIQFNRGDFSGLSSKAPNGELDFLSHFAQMAREKGGTYYDCLTHFTDYVLTEGMAKVPYEVITKDFCNGFADYLLNEALKKTAKTFKENIAHNTAWLYWQRFRFVLKSARKFVNQDILAEIQKIRLEETHREYLSLDELKRAFAASCPSVTVKRAGLFSALTGLRFSDCKKLKYSEIRDLDGVSYIKYQQQKTANKETLPISKDARDLVGDGDDNELVFPGLNRSTVQRYTNEWMKNSGIDRKITFHCFRHTFATLQITLGTDLYVVKDLLGHKDIRTTQLYSKVVDAKKIEAANRIKIL